MDVEYIYDSQNKNHQIDIIGEHSTIGRFLSCELQVHREDVSAIESFITQLKQSKTQQVNFVEWTVEVEKDELKIFHNSILSGSETQTEFDIGSADWQLSSECGKEDLILVLENWADFVKND